MKKDKRKIPKGFYCYRYKRKKLIPCPYWSIRKGKPKQKNGYCAYLGKGDWDINKEKKWRTVYYDKNGKKVYSKLQSAIEIGIPMSLLWDMVKECNIKEDYNE